MSEIKKLIERLCPDGVEYKKLGELGTFYGGLTGKSKKDFGNGNAKFITYMNVYSNPALDLSVTDTVQIAEGEKQNKVQYKDILFTGSSETPEESGMTSVITKEIQEDFYLNSFCFGLRLFNSELFNADFLKHYFRSHEARKAIARTASGVTRFNVSKAKLANFEIPVPPIEVQSKIVEILDNFTELEAELEAQLEAELEARRKQYEYYRDNLFCKSTDIKKIGDLTKVFSCPRVFRNQWKESGIPFWRSSDVMSYHNGVKNPRGEVYISQSLYLELSRKSERIEKGDLLVTGGGSIGMPYLKMDDNPLFVKDADLICIKRCDSFIPSYLYHFFFTTEFRTYLKKITHDATIAHYTINQIKDTPIPIPPLSEQKRIVSILDRFEALTTDLQSGLPAEIEARRKQYEYYREQLLTFKRKTA